MIAYGFQKYPKKLAFELFIMLQNCFSYLLTVLIVFSVYKQIIKSITLKKTGIVMNAKISEFIISVEAKFAITWFAWLYLRMYKFI